MSSLESIIADLRAESDELDALVAPLPAEQWATPTPAAGWTIAHQIGHLLWTDRVALTAVTDEAGFAELLDAAAANPTGFVDSGADELAATAPPRLLADWRSTRRRLHDALLTVPEGRKLPWFGPPMSAASMATARLMETWAHGLDVADALGVRRPATARLRSVAHIGVRTRDYAFIVNGLTPPTEPFYVELRAPDGGTWSWGTPEAAQRVTGSAEDFCALVTQRRPLSTLDITAHGDDAQRWLGIAQAFAGPPAPGDERANAREERRGPINPAPGDERVWTPVGAGSPAAVSLKTSPERASLNGRASTGEARPDNRLSFMDQALFATMRATGRSAVVQAIWIYDDAFDVDGLRRFHHNLNGGLLGRRIERSPLPFARARWVACQGPDIDIAERARPRNELSDWTDERAQLPVDPEHGPGWHLGVLPLTDGSTAVSLVVSHCLVDGLGVAAAIADAVTGNRRDLEYPPPRSRTRLRAVVQDARQTAQDAPEIARALVAAAKEGRKKRARQRDGTQSAASQPTVVSGDGDETFVVPMITAHVDSGDWDARAKALGGMHHHLVTGFAAKLGESMGRRHSHDGLITLQCPISDRTEDDTRANALSFVSVDVDPTGVTTDLRGIRIAQGQAFRAHRETSEGSAQVAALAPLVSFVPRRVLKRAVDAAFAYDDLPVGCSNVGDVDPALGRPAGTAAAEVSARGGEQHVTRGHLERTGGQLTVWVARYGGKVCITVGAYHPGATNSKPALRELTAQTLTAFDLTGVID